MAPPSQAQPASAASCGGWESIHSLGAASKTECPEVRKWRISNGPNTCLRVRYDEQTQPHAPRWRRAGKSLHRQRDGGSCRLMQRPQGRDGGSLLPAHHCQFFKRLTVAADRAATYALFAGRLVCSTNLPALLPNLGHFVRRKQARKL
jgi:hypothetical protein